MHIASPAGRQDNTARRRRAVPGEARVPRLQPIRITSSGSSARMRPSIPGPERIAGAASPVSAGRRYKEARAFVGLGKRARLGPGQKFRAAPPPRPNPAARTGSRPPIRRGWGRVGHLPAAPGRAPRPGARKTGSGCPCSVSAAAYSSACGRFELLNAASRMENTLPRPAYRVQAACGTRADSRIRGRMRWTEIMFDILLSRPLGGAPAYRTARGSDACKRRFVRASSSRRRFSCASSAADQAPLRSGRRLQGGVQHRGGQHLVQVVPRHQREALLRPRAPPWPPRPAFRPGRIPPRPRSPAF